MDDVHTIAEIMKRARRHQAKRAMEEYRIERHGRRFAIVLGSDVHSEYDTEQEAERALRKMIGLNEADEASWEV